MQINTASIIGLGYIGLPTAAILAANGIRVRGMDTNPSIVETINNGKVHIVEPDLDGLLYKMVMAGNLVASTAVAAADVFLITVSTPFKDGHEPDISHVMNAAQSIAGVLKKGNLIILESTSPVGTTEEVSRLLKRLRPDLSFPHEKEDADIYVAYCPERVLPGHILRELVENDRVIGGITKACSEKAVAFYKCFVRGKCVITNARTAEMTKLTENSFRDVNIAFANELSTICDTLGINVWELVELANLHPRVNILRPGPGVGGHCIAVDPWFIVSSAPDESRLIRMAREVNDAKPAHVVKKVLACAKEVMEPRIACLGLSYKADIDDLRESPAVEIVRQLLEGGIKEILAVEPFVKELPFKLGFEGKVRLCGIEDAVREANIVVLLVNHSVFLKMDPKQLSGKKVIDTRGVWA